MYRECELEWKIDDNKKGFAQSHIQKPIFDPIRFQILKWYATGLSESEIAGKVQEEYSMYTTPLRVMNVIQNVGPIFSGWQKRNLQSQYDLLYTAKVEIPFTYRSRTIHKKVILLLGIESQRKSDVLGIWLMRKSETEFWMDVCNELRVRGVQKITVMKTQWKEAFQAAEAIFPGITLEQEAIYIQPVASQLDSVSLIAAARQDTSPIDSQQMTEEVGDVFSALQERWILPTDEVKTLAEKIKGVSTPPADSEGKPGSWYFFDILERFHFTMNRGMNRKGTFTSEDAVYKYFFWRVVQWIARCNE